MTRTAALEVGAVGVPGASAVGLRVRWEEVSRCFLNLICLLYCYWLLKPHVIVLIKLPLYVIIGVFPELSLVLVHAL